MKTHLRLLALFLILLMLVQSTVISTFATTHIDIDTGAYRAAAGTGYTEASDVEYRKSGNYIYNWGAREEDATFLSPNAISFYTGSYTYDVVSSKQGGTSQSNAPSSALYSTLQTLMKSKHSKETSYNFTRDLYQYTDCQLNGKHPQYSNKISSFYSGKLIGPSWDSGSTWNREHTWPNSKGLGGNDENDIMMLRPTSVSENSSRGNTAYGQSSGYYNPNNESGGNYDLRGDVARICLYVYVRWGNTGKMWGTGGVMESMTVLLNWMEADPVDTWEMGRNDSVQSITGTRNVFVDYPEYAWLLFGQEIPSDMVTPSGEASEGACDHNWSVTSTTEATCTASGSTSYTCTICKQTKTETTVSALGHSWSVTSTTEATCTVNGSKISTCSRCGTIKTETIKAAGHSYTNDDWVIDKEATETETGSKHRVCPTCNYTETVTIPLLGHEHKYTSVVTDPTCYDEGYTTHTCPCGHSYKDSYKDILRHSYSNGICSLCGAKDPSAPTFTVNDFSSIITKLASGIYSGKERYVKICEAINIYNNLSDSDKASVSGRYNMLKNIISQYNDETNAVNSDAEQLNAYVAEINLVSVSAVYFAAYSLLKKKHF